MRKKFFRVLFVCLLIAMGAGMAVAQENVTVTGTINEDNQLVIGEDQAYDIADTENGASLIENVGKKVSVTGTVQDMDGVKTIVVESFEVMEE